MEYKQEHHRNPKSTSRANGYPVLVILFVFLLSSSLLISSCDSKKVFDINKAIPGERWNRSYIAAFDFANTDTTSLFDVYVDIRNTVDYKYSNLFLFITTYSPDHKKSRDTIECLIARPDGKWVGKGFGKIKSSRSLLKGGGHFPNKGIYRFEIEQAMRQDALDGISDIGLRIEKQ